MAAAADGGVVTLGKRGVEHGALHAGDTGGQPDAAPPREETGAMETAPAGIGEAEAWKRETVIIIGLTLALFSLEGYYDFRQVLVNSITAANVGKAIGPPCCGK